MQASLVKKAFKFTDTSGRKQQPNFEVPDVCPICNRGISPERETIFCLAIGEPAQIAFSCPYADCRRLFIARYSWDEKEGYILEKTEPVYPQKRAFPQEIATISPSFEKLYNQALAAEAYGLTEVCGAGYRKALEFLVKDYLIQVSPQDASDIKKEFLGTCIKTRVQDVKVKQCAELAAWLGNDETHYERRWVGKDLGDLKLLIDLTVHWVSSELLTQKYSASMQKP